ncbi:MAG: alkyl hydroperoxide reductase [Gammaproteobacteria bacterium SG8_11]|nr:MAG: alkyl hydroperoxide reductase [Gammaproteobacteria bacterium SG8_11]
MKLANRISISQFATILVLFMMALSVHAKVTVGKSAPDFSAVDSKGNKQTLSGYLGKTVILEWTNHDCPYVRKHYNSGNMQALQKETTQQGMVWLSIISSAPGKQGHVSAQQANELTQSRGAAPTAVIFDSSGDIGRSYGAKTTPHMYIIDSKGTLVYMGGIDDTPTTDPEDVKSAKNYVRAALNQMASGKDITEAVTRPYGCSVKY